MKNETSRIIVYIENGNVEITNKRNRNAKICIKQKQK